MGLGIMLIPLHPGAPIRASDVNTNFSALNNATTFTGEVTGTLAGGSSALQLKGGALGVSVDTNGFVTFHNTFQGYAGIVPQCSQLFGIGSGTYNHSLGVVPDALFVQANFTNTPVQHYTYSNLTATTVSIYTNDGGVHFAGFAWKLV